MSLDPTAFVASPEFIHTLTAHAAPIACETDRTLFHQDDPATGLFILLQGQISLSMASQTGETILSAEARDGSLLGLPGLISNQPYSLTAVARAGAQVKFLARAEFNTLMHADAALSFNILQILAAEVRSARQALY